MIDQLRVVSLRVLPLLNGLRTPQAKTKLNPTALALGLVGSEFFSKMERILQRVDLDLVAGKIDLNEIMQILPCLTELWQGSNSWMEFFEQIVYILVALVLPQALVQSYLQPLLTRAAIA